MYCIKPPRKNASKVVKKPQSQKLKRNFLNFLQREKVIEQIKMGYSVEKISMSFGVSVATVYRIIKQEEQLKHFRTNNPHSPVRKNFKGPQYPELDEILKNWVYHQRSCQRVINNKIIAEKAKEFFAILYILYNLHPV